MTAGILELKRLASSFSVLYVEDEPRVREQMRLFLGKLFAKVGVAADGREGLRSFRDGHYDLVITDLRMPGLDGLEMVERIRAKDAEVPVIVSTAFNDSDYLLRSIDLGVSHYLLKPLETPALVKALFKTLSHLGLERKVHELTARIRELLNVQTNLMVVVRGDQITTANKRFLDLFGVANLHQFRDQGHSLVKYLVDEEGFCYPRDGGGWAHACMEPPEMPRKVKLRDPKSNDARIFLVDGAPLPGPEEEYVLSFTDISEVEEQYRVLKQEASTDPLTKLPNWLRFHSELDRGIGEARRSRSPLSVVLFKPDDFSALNDRFGLHFGDGLLIELSELIRANLRRGRAPARLSGVEFGLILPDTDLARAREQAQRLRTAVENWSFGAEQHLTCAFGVTELRDGDTLDDLFERANQLLLRAKRKGPGGLVCDTPRRAPERRRERDEIANLLQRAMDEEIAITFFNIYKGLGINSGGELLSEQVGGELLFRVTDNQAKAMGREGATVIACPLLPMRVAAKVRRVSMHELSVTLGELHYTPTTAMDRAVLRIEPEQPIPVKIHEKEADGGGLLHGEIVDVSFKALAVRLYALGRLRLGANVELHFQLPAGKENHVEMSLEGRVLKLDETALQAVVSLFTNKPMEARLSHYISQRQLELVHELQSYSL